MKAFVEKMQKPAYLLSRFVWYASVVITAILVALVLFQVIMRYCFNSGYPWIEEFCMICLMWMAFLGGSMIFYDQTAINVTMITDKLPLKAYKIVTIFFHVLTLIFFVFLVIYGFQFAIVGGKMVFSASGLPRSVAYMSIPFGSFVSLLFELYHTLKCIVNPPYRPEVGEPEVVIEGLEAEE